MERTCVFDGVSMYLQGQLFWMVYLAFCNPFGGGMLNGLEMAHMWLIRNINVNLNVFWNTFLKLVLLDIIYFIIMPLFLRYTLILTYHYFYTMTLNDISLYLANHQLSQIFDFWQIIEVITHYFMKYFTFFWNADYPGLYNHIYEFTHIFYQFLQNFLFAVFHLDTWYFSHIFFLFCFFHVF